MRLAGAFDAGRSASCCLGCLCWLLVTGAARVSAPNKRLAVPRYLVYPPPAGSTTKVQLIFGLGIPMEVDVSTIVGYVMKCNYNLPYNASYLSEPYVRYARSPQYDGSSSSSSSSSSAEDLNDYDEDAESSPGVVERAGVYRMIEAAISSGSQLEGKPCLLRAICEAAATPFDTRTSTVFARLLHIFLTPSSTAEPIDQQYLAAERMGVRAASSGHSAECAHAFAECRANFLEYFSEIHWLLPDARQRGNFPKSPARPRSTAPSYMGALPPRANR